MLNKYRRLLAVSAVAAVGGLGLLSERIKKDPVGSDGIASSPIGEFVDPAMGPSLFAEGADKREFPAAPYNARIRIELYIPKSGTGHAAVSVTRRDSEYSRKRISLWPDSSLPMILALKMAGLKPSNYSKTDDWMSNGCSPYTYDIYVTDEQGEAALAEIEAIQAGIRNGTVSYSLFANWCLGHILNNCAPGVSAWEDALTEPFSGTMEAAWKVAEEADARMMKSVTYLNCTLSVGRVLEAAGLEAPTNHWFIPFGYFPSALGSTVDRAEKAGYPVLDHSDRANTKVGAFLAAKTTVLTQAALESDAARERAEEAGAGF